MDDGLRTVGRSWSPACRRRVLCGEFGDHGVRGARSVTGPLLASLGASAVLVGLISGAGEAMARCCALSPGHGRTAAGVTGASPSPAMPSLRSACRPWPSHSSPAQGWR